MDCHQVREQLNAFLDSELGEFETRHIAAHVEECASCRHELDAYRSTRDFMRQFGNVPTPPNMSENIRIIMEKERLIPRRSKARSLFTASRASTVGRFALAATFLLAILASGSYYIYDTIGDHQKIAAQKAAQTSSALAERQTPAATAAAEYVRSLEKESPSPPEMLSLDSIEDEAVAHAEESGDGLFADLDDAPAARSHEETAVARSLPSQPARVAQPAGAAPPAPRSADSYGARAAAPRAAAPTDSLDIMVEGARSLSDTASGAGPGALPTVGDGAAASKTRSLKPFSEFKGLAGRAGETHADAEDADALADLSWTVAKRSLPQSAPESASMADKPTASKPVPASAKSTRADTKDKKKLPALNIILKARSGQPQMQQQAMMKQLQPLLDSGAAQMQNGKVVLNMPADETLKFLQTINADPSNVAPVPVPEKMLQNEITSKEPRLVNTEIIFMPDEAKPAEPAAEADKTSGDDGDSD